MTRDIQFLRLPVKSTISNNLRCCFGQIRTSFEVNQITFKMSEGVVLLTALLKIVYLDQRLSKDGIETTSNLKGFLDRLRCYLLPLIQVN